MAMPQIAHVRQSFNENIHDEDVVWALQLHESRRQLQWCLPALRASYPCSRVVVISDGDSDDYEDLVQQYHCDYVTGQHLMTLSTCHLYVERLFRALLAGTETYCIKIDPDTRIWRRFARLPAFSCIFGTLETITEGHGSEILFPANVQGGCIGMTRDAVEEMCSSGLLTAETCSAASRTTWARCEDMVATVAAGRFCDDFVISWLASQLHIPIVESAEIRSRWRRRVQQTRELRFAVTHPHKI